MAGETPITIVGNLTADPDLRYTQNGLPVVNFTVAVTPRYFDRQSNEWKDGTATFWRCSAWREFAEHIAGSLTKGSRVIASGNVAQRPYETKEGEKRTSTEIEITAIGPDLRYATAVVSRASMGAPSGESRSQTTDWDVASPGGQQARRADDAWAAPRTGGQPAYGEDTPF